MWLNTIIFCCIQLCFLDIDECEENPCQNEGTCENEEGSYTCNCGEGFKGDNCDEGIDISYSLFIYEKWFSQDMLLIINM